MKSVLDIVPLGPRQVFRLVVVLALVLGSAGVSRAAGPAAADGFRLLDLSPVANSSEALTGRQFSGVPIGLQSFRGVPFLLGPRFAVAGMEAARAGEVLPDRVTGIKIGARVRRIHLLHGTLSPDKDGVPVANLVWHYASGAEESQRLGYGVHVRDWTTPRAEKRSELFDPNSHVSWSESDDRSGGERRFFQTALENPRPEEVVTSIDVVSLFSHAAPFVAAISAEEPGSGLPANLPLPPRKAVRAMREFGDSVYRRELVVHIKDGEINALPANAVASLTIVEDKEMCFLGEKKPDAQGVFRFVYPPQQTVGFYVWVHAPDRLPVLVSESKTNQANFTGDYSAVLRRGVRAGGLVRQADGKPIAGAQIVISHVTRISPHHYNRIDYDAVTTAADGKWTSGSLPKDLGGFTFEITHPDFAPGLYATEGVAPSPTDSGPVITSGSSSVSFRRLGDGTLVPLTQVRRVNSRSRAVPLVTTNALLAGNAEMILRPATLLEGTVVDNRGRPIPAAEVIVQSQGSSSGRKFLHTDAGGRFQTRVTDSGSLAVIVIRDKFTPVYRSINGTDGMRPMEIKLSPARVLRGRVQDPKQHPVADAKVRLDLWHGTSDLLRFQAVTDQEGRFTWTGAPPDQLTFYLSKSNYMNNRHSVSATGNEITLMINRASGVYGRVYDAATKRPIDMFTVIPGRRYSTSDSQPINWERDESVRGHGGEYTVRIQSYMFSPEARILVEAPGYLPQISPAFNGPDSYTNDFALKPGKGLEGVVQTPDGVPAVGATVVLVEKNQYAYLDAGGQFRSVGSSGELVRTDTRGHFEFAPKLEPERIYVSHPEGFGEASVADVEKNGRVVLQKWGQVAGLLRVGDKIEPDQSVRLQNYYEQYPKPGTLPSMLSFYLKADVDAVGRFLFENVPPGEHQIALEYRFRQNRNGGETPLSHGFLVEVQPGGRSDVVLGGTGRKVLGRVALLGGDQSDVDWKRDVHRLTLALPGVPQMPANMQNLSPREQQLIFSEFSRLQRAFTPDKARANERAARSYVLVFDTNGTFRADNVPPGKYILSLNVSDPEEEYYSRRFIGTLNKEVVIPDEPNAGVNAPLDIGSLELTIHPRLKIGKTVPPFDAKTADGKAIKLADYRGKFVLLHFWGLSLGYNTYDFQVLKEFQDTYGRNGKLVIIGCNLDANQQSGEQFAENQGMTWTQVYLGNWNQNPVAGMFGFNGSTGAVLIDAEGKLASGPLRGSGIRNMVLSALSGSETE